MSRSRGHDQSMTAMLGKRFRVAKQSFKQPRGRLRPFVIATRDIALTTRAQHAQGIVQQQEHWSSLRDHAYRHDIGDNI